MRSWLAFMVVVAGCGADATSGVDADVGASVATDAATRVEVDTSAALDTREDTDTVIATETSVSDADAVAEVSEIDAAAEVDAADPDLPGPTKREWYDPAVLHTVDIRLDPNDWDLMRHQTRTLLQILGPDCMSGPPPDVFTWFHADATIDGFVVAEIGIKKKGFLGSLDENRPSIRIETDHFVDDLDLGELEHITLNNGRQDPSRVRQCLAYEVFRAAGLPASRCSFVHVTVNGADLGLYVNVEPVRHPFVASAFGETPDVQLWEGALSDFREGWLGTFESKLDANPSSDAPLAAVIEALARPDAEVLDALDAVIDLDQFMTFWATESLIGHWDGYAGNTNNFYVYRAPDGRLRFIPWGVDGTFVDPAQRGQNRPTTVFAEGALARRLYKLPAGRARYQAELRRVLARVWDESALIERIAAWDTLTWDAREDGNGEDGSQGIADLKAFVQTRRARITAELDGPASGANWNQGLRGALCMDAFGTASGTFTTTWGTLPVDNLFTTGACSITLDSDQLPDLTYDLFGAKAGEDTDALPGRAQIWLASHVVGAGYIVVTLATSLPLAPGQRAIDGTTTEGIVYYLDPDNQFQVVGYLQEGAVTFTAASTLEGDAIEGTFTGTMFNF